MGKHFGVEVETTNSIGMKFRVIPPGVLLMGNSEEEIAKLNWEANEPMIAGFCTRDIPNESPQHKVILTKPFRAGNHEVTRGQFRRFVEATSNKTDAEKDG